MKQLLYVLFAIFLYVQIGGLWGIANQIERDIDYFIDCHGAGTVMIEGAFVFNNHKTHTYNTT